MYLHPSRDRLHFFPLSFTLTLIDNLGRSIVTRNLPVSFSRICREQHCALRTPQLRYALLHQYIAQAAGTKVLCLRFEPGIRKVGIILVHTTVRYRQGGVQKGFNFFYLLIFPGFFLLQLLVWTGLDWTRLDSIGLDCWLSSKSHQNLAKRVKTQNQDQTSPHSYKTSLNSPSCPQPATRT